MDTFALHIYTDVMGMWTVLTSQMKRIVLKLLEDTNRSRWKMVYITFFNRIIGYLIYYIIYFSFVIILINMNSFMCWIDILHNKWFGWFMVFNVTFNNISVISLRSVSLVEETGVPGEYHRPAVNHWQTLSHNVVSSIPRHEWGSNSQQL
jgi:hypothetical protein